MEQLLIKVADYGPIAVIAVFLIWKQAKDYAGVCSRLNQVEDYVKAQLSTLVERNIQAIDRNTVAISQCEKISKGGPRVHPHE